MDSLKIKPTSEKTAKSVSIKDFSLWLEKNIYRTWHLEHGGWVGGRTDIKYISPFIDTRDMRVFCVKIWGGFSKEIVVHNTDLFDGTILQLLEKKLGEQK